MTKALDIAYERAIASIRRARAAAPEEWTVHEGRPSWHQARAGHTSAAKSIFSSRARAEEHATNLRKHHPYESIYVEDKPRKRVNIIVYEYQPRPGLARRWAVATGDRPEDVLKDGFPNRERAEKWVARVLKKEARTP